MEITNVKELSEINGGISITGTLVSAVTKAASFVFDLGQALGSTIRRISTNNMCPIK